MDVTFDSIPPNTVSKAEVVHTDCNFLLSRLPHSPRTRRGHEQAVAVGRMSWSTRHKDSDRAVVADIRLNTRRQFSVTFAITRRELTICRAMPVVPTPTSIRARSIRIGPTIPTTTVSTRRNRRWRWRLISVRTLWRSAVHAVTC